MKYASNKSSNWTDQDHPGLHSSTNQPLSRTSSTVPKPQISTELLMISSITCLFAPGNGL